MTTPAAEPRRWHPELGGGIMPEPTSFEAWDDFARMILGPDLSNPGHWLRALRMRVRP